MEIIILNYQTIKMFYSLVLWIIYVCMIRINIKY